MLPSQAMRVLLNRVTQVVYHLPQIPSNSGWDVNDKQFFDSSHWKIPATNGNSEKNHAKITAYRILSMSLGWFWPILLFSLRDINLTLGLLPPRKHVVWRDSVGVESSGSGLKIIVRGYFASEFSLLRHTDEPQKGRNSCLWLQTRYVLSSFGVLLMSCRVKFHVVRSALQYSACRIICLHVKEERLWKNAIL